MTDDRLRGPKTQERDYEQLVQAMVDHKFDDWPNEAGFEGLTEVRGPVELKVQGHLPPWIAGTLFRTGPGQYDIDDTANGPYRTTHWFDGFAQSHKFEIIPDQENPNQPVRVMYSSRRQSEGLVNTIKKDGARRRHITFSQRSDPCVGMMGKFMTVWRHGSIPHREPDEDNSCVTVMTNVPGLRPFHQDGGLVTTESGHRSGGAVKSVWLTTDSNTMKQVDRDTLEPIGLAEQRDLHPSLTGPMSCAHAQIDPETGDLYNYNLDLSKTSTYRIFRVNAATGTTDILATIAQPDIPPAYNHSFLMSKSYLILCVGSTHIGKMGLSVVWNRNIAESVEPFDESKTCKWIVVDRRRRQGGKAGGGGVVGTFETPAGFFFHSINAFEDEAGPDEETGDVDLYCDVLQYPTLDVIRSYEMDIMRGSNTAATATANAKATQKGFWGDEQTTRNSLPTFIRYKFVIRGNKKQPSRTWSSLIPSPTAILPSIITGGPNMIREWRRGDKVREIKAPRVGELPTINPSYATRPYRYFYSLPNTGKSALLDSIAKTDIDNQTSLFWDNPKGHTPGEAIFVARPREYRNTGADGVTGDGGEEEGGDEDDGVLLSVVLDGYGRTSYLVCIDARTMKELGRAECEWAVGFGFHGVHAPSPQDSGSSG